MTNSVLTDKQALVFRLAVGGLFGLGAGWLGKMLELAHAMPDLWVHVTLSTLLLGGFVLLAGAGTMRPLSLTIWGVAALGVIAVIAWNHAANGLGDSLPSPFFFDDHFLIYPFLFIAHVLVSGADMTGRPVAPFAVYFDQATKRAVQLVLAVIFTVLFWGILWLGAALLGFIGFEWLRKLLQNQYFIGPAIGLALAAAVHLGDAQAKMLGHVRVLVLSVLSWLLPVIAVIGLLFAVSLAFSGLAPLWATKAATSTLLGACMALVLLILATYQQGDEERPVHVVLRWAVRLAALLLLAFALIATYSLCLRIGQYGLTPERIIAAVGVGLAVLFGLGYAAAAVAPGRWFRLSEPVNVAMAFVMVAVFGAVLTPVSEPARISVDNQVARLQSAKVATDKFDWKLLRFNTGAYGTHALDALIKNGKTPAIRDAAAKAKALKDSDRYAADAVVPIVAKPTASQLNVVYPAGGAMPDSFMAQDFTLNEGSLPTCMKPKSPAHICNVAIIDLNRDGQPEIVLQANDQLHVFRYYIANDRHTEVWDKIQITQYGVDKERAEAFAKGDIKAAPSLWDDLEIGGVRYKVHDADGDTDVDD